MLYTVGHSNRAQTDLLDLLGSAGIQALVDVRARPHSGRFSQYIQDELRGALEAAGIVYHWAGRQLGGMRPPQPESLHAALREAGMRAYADYMQTQAFRTAADQLITMAGRSNVAIMCAERDPDHCHRSLISDYLALQGVQVMHLIDIDQTREHLLRPEARREASELVYDRHAQDELGL